jgi:hypothetical protein
MEYERFQHCRQAFPRYECTIITNLNAMSESYNIRIDGMLGCDFFEQGIISMNLKKKNLVFVFMRRKNNEKPDKIFAFAICCLLSLAGNGQSVPERAGRLENNKFILKIDLKWSEEQKEKLAMLFELDSIVIAKIFEKDLAFINDSTEWNAAMIQQGLVELSKDLGKPVRYLATGYHTLRCDFSIKNPFSHARPCACNLWR